MDQNETTALVVYSDSPDIEFTLPGSEEAYTAAAADTVRPRRISPAAVLRRVICGFFIGCTLITAGICAGHIFSENPVSREDIPAFLLASLSAGEVHASPAAHYHCTAPAPSPDPPAAPVEYPQLPENDVRKEPSPLTLTNETVCRNNRLDMFVTVWLGILEISTGKVTASNAGHEFPVIRQPGGSYELFKDKHGFVVGGMEGVRYRTYEFTLQKGGTLFVYTDGVPEATSASGELFGTGRLLQTLNGMPQAGPEELLSGVTRSVETFVGEAPQFDDLTMLAITLNNGETD